MAKKPKGLPTGPQGLPAVRDVELKDISHLDDNVRRARICQGCGRKGRVVSNQLGVNVHCGPCKRHWPITNGPVQPETPMSIPRGFSKQTHVEPNWDSAYDDIPDGN